MEINNVAVNNFIFNNYDVNKKNNNELSVMPIDEKKDSIDFSIDYSNDQVKNILENVQQSFGILPNGINDDYLNGVNDISTPIFNMDLINKQKDYSIKDYSEQYGSILKNITNSSLDDYTKDRLTNILNKSYDNFTENKGIEYGKKLDAFFNMSSSAKEFYYKQKTDMGIIADKLIDKDRTISNIKNIISSAKIFYANNLDSSNEEFEAFINSKFATTDRVDEMSYNDFNAVNKAIDYIYANGGVKDTEAVKKSVDILQVEGASAKIMDLYKTAIKQDLELTNRVDAYKNIKFGYEDNIKKLKEQSNADEKRLNSLEKLRHELVKEYNKQMQKLKYESYKLKLMELNAGQVVEYNEELEDLTKYHNLRLKGLDEQRSEIEKSIAERKKVINETTKHYTEFIKSPASAIDDYLKSESNKKSGDADLRK
ncbi:hypothetical protein [Clostridium folliculivorans]|uniref:Uncharacterized protein n=1 Tax=Clostridium folliculivorans TaxID=2886038 RepID=A0A9W6DAG2_9CLOT|nr:hypothetical protein [Clostridium folliculivorans]GKU24648.1 hypothetical protein CFOLD11_14740 [Clostridium folliculivorans]GKU30746.1 hypothetical protein CFB3_28530 [Clostridium folliculivorans]